MNCCRQAVGGGVDEYQKSRGDSTTLRDATAKSSELAACALELHLTQSFFKEGFDPFDQAQGDPSFKETVEQVRVPNTAESAREVDQA
jgi:hypothetical protein